MSIPQIPKTSPRKQSSHWLLWWKINPEELQVQVAGYDTLPFAKSARGASVIFLLLSATITGVCAYFKFIGMDEWEYIDVALSALLCVFIYRGHKWAMIVAMLYWTGSKGMQIAAFLMSPDPMLGGTVMSVIWWAVYMHAFYLALRTERARKAVMI